MIRLLRTYLAQRRLARLRRDALPRAGQYAKHRDAAKLGWARRKSGATA